MISTKPPLLIITTDVFLQRIAWLEFNGHVIEANALRDLAALFVPAYSVDEMAVQGHIAVLEDAQRNPPKWD